MRRVWILILAGGLLAGCERAKQDMYDQPRYKTFAASSLFEDGASARTAPAGTQPRARGAFADSSGGRRGTAAVQADLDAARAQANPYPVDLALLRRGQDRYDIYCLPCHSPAGDGDGLVVRRGFPAPPSFHIERLRSVPDRYIYDVITHGHGVMVPYADRVEPAERWAIVAFVRALQLSQHAAAADLPPELRARLPAQAGVDVPAEAPPPAAPRAQQPVSTPALAPPLRQGPSAPGGRP
jgi:mono/diheme cytochrome c family protein